MLSSAATQSRALIFFHRMAVIGRILIVSFLAMASIMYIMIIAVSFETVLACRVFREVKFGSANSETKMETRNRIPLSSIQFAQGMEPTEIEQSFDKEIP